MHRFDGEVRAIQQVVDEHAQVRDSASPRLSELRGEMESAREHIRQIVYDFVRNREIAQYLQSTTVQMHEDRYVLPLRAEQRGRIPASSTVAAIRAPRFLWNPRPAWNSTTA